MVCNIDDSIKLFAFKAIFFSVFIHFSLDDRDILFWHDYDNVNDFDLTDADYDDDDDDENETRDVIVDYLLHLMFLVCY